MDRLIQVPNFEPIDLLITQIDRSAANVVLEFKKEGTANRIFIDSGAFSDHRGDITIDVDEYIDYLNSIDEYIEVCAQVDKIPGRFGEPKKPEDYVESAKRSWDNYLYMRDKLISPHKLTPVFHQGESMEHLQMMLDWTDSDGNHIDYIGVSPSNDRSQQDKDIYMANVYDVIRHSNHPNVKTHLYGMTSMDSLKKFPCYSADSISHRLVAAYNKVKIPRLGVVPLSRLPRSTRVKSNLSIFDTSDEWTHKELIDYITYLGSSEEKILAEPNERIIVTMYTIMQEVKELNKNGLKPPKVARKLF